MPFLRGLALVWAEALRVSAEGKVENMGKTKSVERRDIVAVKREKRCPGRDAARIEMDDEMRIIE